MEDFRNSSEALNWHGSGSVTGSPAVLLPPSLDGESCICPAHLPICMVRSAVMSGTTAFVFKKPLFYLIMVPKPRSSNAINSDMPKRSYEVLPLSEKVSILHLLGNEKKSKLHAGVARIYGKNESSVKLSHLKRAKVLATLCHRYLVKLNKALNLYNKTFWERETTFTWYLLHYIVIIVLFIIYFCWFHTVPNLEIKLHHRYVCIGKKHSIHRFPQGPQWMPVQRFRHPLGTLEHIPCG